jgi:hypothetical protein
LQLLQMSLSFNYGIKRFKAGIGFPAMGYLFPDQIFWKYET